MAAVFANRAASSGIAARSAAKPARGAVVARAASTNGGSALDCECGLAPRLAAGSAGGAAAVCVWPSGTAAWETRASLAHPALRHSARRPALCPL